MIALSYHDRTKHNFGRFARSLGYLDWATQPDPFRRYQGAPLIELPRSTPAGDVAYAALFDGSVPPAPVDLDSIGEFLRCSMGLSAWKQYASSRWALRVNPSSGNLHPTEAYVVHGAGVFHYAPREHALEQRCVLAGDVWEQVVDAPQQAFLVGLTSIHWREAWKYGERAFRYCQHDVGHALGAMRLAAAMLGWRFILLPDWDSANVARLLGIDRDEDYRDAEREAGDCLAIVGPDVSASLAPESATLAAVAGESSWLGEANRLSRAHVEWEVIDEVAEASKSTGHERAVALSHPRTLAPGTSAPSHPHTLAPHPVSSPRARSVILSRRSAVEFDGRSSLPRHVFLSILQRLRPGNPPWDAIGWSPHVHLVLFVHRVEGLVPGVYAFLRDDRTRADWRASMREEFLWEPIAADDSDEARGLFLLVPVDAGPTAMRLSCDQAIAADGFFSLAMVARLEESLLERGESFYPRLFWECGLIGQVLYLEAEAAGARGTGIGCFYDDPVHELLGLTGHRWQSLYHFSMGVPVEDTRLTAEPGYPWEVPADATP
ncbi:MAG: SagB/ThcOx family dehydrogenase [Acidobacteria bacterium]|nr:SagB/ThcOx family dehydrogenase [Acidobacteriota bacterium]